MKKSIQRKIALFLTVAAFGFYGFVKFAVQRTLVSAQTTVAQTPTPTPEFNQSDAIAKLKEQIKGKEQEPAEKVFKIFNQ